MRTNKSNTVYVVSMAIYYNDRKSLYTNVIDVFTDKRCAEYAMEGALQNFTNEICDICGIDPADTEPYETQGETVMDFSAEYGRVGVFRISERPVLTKNRAWPK